MKTRAFMIISVLMTLGTNLAAAPNAKITKGHFIRFTNGTHGYLEITLSGPTSYSGFVPNLDNNPAVNYVILHNTPDGTYHVTATASGKVYKYVFTLTPSVDNWALSASQDWSTNKIAVFAKTTP